MSRILVLLCLSAAFASAQKGAAPKTYPVWWSPDLKLAKLEDVKARLAQPFSDDDLYELRATAEAFGEPAQPVVHNCNELLAVIDPNKWTFSSLDRVGGWGGIGADCAILRELGHAAPARESAVQELDWTAALFSLLPASICYADGEASHASAVDADKRGLSLREYWKGKAGTHTVRGSGRVLLTLDDDYVRTFYDLVAKGDFDGDGWEEIVIGVRGAPPHSARMTFAVYVLSRKSAAGRFQVVKAIF